MMILLVVGLSLAVAAQKDRPNQDRPPKPNPPKVEPGKPPRDNPKPPKGDDKPKKPEMAVLITFRDEEGTLT